MLLAAIDENHRGTYDFLYLPIDFKVTFNYPLLNVGIELKPELVLLAILLHTNGQPMGIFCLNRAE